MPQLTIDQEMSLLVTKFGIAECTAALARQANERKLPGWFLWLNKAYEKMSPKIN